MFYQGYIDGEQVCWNYRSRKEVMDEIEFILFEGNFKKGEWSIVKTKDEVYVPKRD